MREVSNHHKYPASEFLRISIVSQHEDHHVVWNIEQPTGRVNQIMEPAASSEVMQLNFAPIIQLIPRLVIDKINQSYASPPVLLQR